MTKNVPPSACFASKLLLAAVSIGLAGVVAFGVGKPLVPAKPTAGKPPAKKPAPAKPLASVKSSEEVRADRVDAAMKKAIDYLYLQNKSGNWEAVKTRDPKDELGGTNGRQWTGLTALTIYALLSAGESPADKRMAAGIDFLMANPSEGVYASACRCLVWSRLSQTQAVRAAGQKDVALLLSAVQSKGDANGLMYYGPVRPGEEAKTDGKYDHSTSQMGALGLSVMVPLGYEVPQKFWFQTEQAWQNHQYPDGAWSYTFNGSATGHGLHTASMSAAGVATLFITQNFLNSSNDCKGNADDPHIDKGLNWLGTNFAATFDVNREINKLHLEGYGLFAVSRVGVASGLRYFGKIDWYEQGADYLLTTQQPDGSWISSVPAGTPFSLLFLAYGSSPAVLNKLEYTTSADAGKPAGEQWDQRPQDLLNFVDWMGHRLERRLNWQVVNLSAPVAAMHDAPILVIAGTRPLSFSEPERARLRQFVSEGGMIVGNSDCDKKEFADSFTKLGTDLFPGYEFRELPASHPIYTNEQYHAAQFKHPPHLIGLSNGVRELMLLPDDDLSRAFQHRSDAVHPDSYQLLADIVLYAMDTSGLERRGKTYLVRENPAAPINRTIKLARLQYSGNWNPEPGGWTRLKAVLHNTRMAALQIETVKLGDGKLITPPAAPVGSGARPTDKEIRAMAAKRIPPAELAAAAAEDPKKLNALIDAQVAAIKKELDAGTATTAAGTMNYPVAHLTGTTAIQFTDAERQDLKKYVAAGGTLIIDAAGGSTQFAASVEQMLTDTFGAEARQIDSPLAPGSPVYQQPGHIVKEVQYRQFAHSRISSGRAPQLRGIRIGGRLAIIYSREDLSAGLVGEPVDGVTGYSPASATELMADIILSAGSTVAVAKE